MRDNAQISGYVTLFIGVALLAFTFISAYLFLGNNPTIAGSPDLVTVFGTALAPLIETCIRVMYLGVMGWIGSVLTIRGVNLITQLRREAKPEIKPEVEPIVPETLETSEPEIIRTSKPRRTKRIRKAKPVKRSA